MSTDLEKTFLEALAASGATAGRAADAAGAARCIAERAGGPVLLADFPSSRRLDLEGALRKEGVEPLQGPARESAPLAAAGVTGANFAIAETGTLVLESTPEAIRLASTLPPRHIVLLDPRKIVADSAAALPLLREFHRRLPACYLAYITGPSRTADIERVLTIGVHGPAELHVLLVEGISEDCLEM